ncbi:MAG TPA: amidohydrolase family protein, partial [Planctomycetota bacterium]|nr:amidohydrolase family protein [Planctomycetota bacterium]
MTVYRGHILTPIRGGGWIDLPDGTLEVRDGTIVAVGRAKRHDFDLRPHLVLPGFVDTHAHVPQLSLCGVHPDGLLPWLRKWVYPIEAEFQGGRAVELSRRFIQEMLANGTTSAGLLTSAWPESVDACFEAVRDAGLHAWIGPPLMDIGAYRRARVLEEAEGLARRWHSARQRFAVTPRFALSCTQELLEGAGDLARRLDLPIQTHLNENPDEIREVRHRFHKPYIDVYADAGLVRRDSLFAHCVWMSKRDWKTVHRVAHCPTSNLFLRSGIMDWAAARRSGATLSLGSDVGAGPGLSIYQVMRSAWEIHAASSTRGPGPEDLLRMATLGGAEALGFDDIGALEPGRCADFQVLDWN